MTTFLLMSDRIARELRRSNLAQQIKEAINDAILEASTKRFYFNEVKALTFATVAGQEFYDDLDLVEIDLLYYYQGTQRLEVVCQSDLDIQQLALNATGGQVTDYSRTGSKIRLWPVPSSAVIMYVDGLSKLTPFPLADDSSTNAWFTSGERYIRALAKRNIMRDVVRDLQEAVMLEAIADDCEAELIEATTRRSGTNTLAPTQF